MQSQNVWAHPQGSHEVVTSGTEAESWSAESENGVLTLRISNVLEDRNGEERFMEEGSELRISWRMRGVGAQHPLELKRPGVSLMR